MPSLCAQKQIDKNTWFYKDSNNDNDNNNTRTNTYILHKQYSRPSEPAQIPPHLLPTAPAPSRKLSLSILGSTTSTGVALFGAQHSRRSGTTQIPRYLLPSAPAPSMKLSLSVFRSTTSTVEAPRGAQYSRLSGPAQIPLFSLLCFLAVRPPVPEPVNGGRRCRLRRIPPTTACGATSVLGTVEPSSLPGLNPPGSAFTASADSAGPRVLWFFASTRFLALLGRSSAALGRFWPLLGGSWRLFVSLWPSGSVFGMILESFLEPKSMIFEACFRTSRELFLDLFFSQLFVRRCSESCSLCT